MLRKTMILFVFCGCAGCGQEGISRYEISGTVTFQGQPVPEGNIAFEPVDEEIGEGYAFIQDGQYDTSDSGRGHLGGPHRIRITGTAGTPIDPNNPDSGCVPLFPPFETTAELPSKGTTMDFQVPTDAGS